MLSKILFWVLQTLSCFSSLTWFVVGAFWRFSRGGRVASGDKLERIAGTSDDQWAQDVQKAMLADGYQIQGGKAMAMLIYVVVVALFILVFSGSLLMIITCLCGSPENKKRENIDASSSSRRGSRYDLSFQLDNQDDDQEDASKKRPGTGQNAEGNAASRQAASGRGDYQQNRADLN